MKAAVCGPNQESYLIAGSEGVADTPEIAQAIAWMLFLDAWFKADVSLRAFGAQPCPDGCKKKTPDPSLPTYGNFQFKLRYDAGAASKAAVPAQPAIGGRPATPAQPAVPARPSSWICTIGMQGDVTFTCNDPAEG